MKGFFRKLRSKFFRRNEMGTLYLYKGETVVITVWNQFIEIINSGKYNWTNFNIITIEFENDHILCEKEINLALFGFCMYIAIIYKEEKCEKRFERWEKEITNAIK